MKSIKIILTLFIFILVIFIISFPANAYNLLTEKNEPTPRIYGNIEGFVFDPNGIPLENAHVYIAGGHVSLAHFGNELIVSQTKTNRNGYYYIERIPTGIYTIFVFRNEFDKEDNWKPALRFTEVDAFETTIEIFYLQKHGRSRSKLIFQQIFHQFLEFQNIFNQNNIILFYSS